MRLCIFGGGRWSRVILDALPSQGAGKGIDLLWVARHGHALALSHAKGRARVFRDPEEAWKEAPDAVIVATAPREHGPLVEKAISLGIPTLSEKPLTLDLAEAERLAALARSKGVPLGVDFEFLYASYLQDFAKRLSSEGVLPRTIEVEWLDPWSEIRYGETKHGELYTPIVQDAYPHAWSVVSVVAAELAPKKLERVEYSEDGRVTLYAGSVTLRFSRRNERRVRRVTINGGEALLDFSVEPGTSTVAGVERAGSWSGPRPLERALSGFLSVVRDPTLELEWPLSARNLLPASRLADEAAAHLKRSQLSLLTRLKREGRLRADDEAASRLLIDLWLPMLADRGARLASFAPEELQRATLDALASLSPTEQ